MTERGFRARRLVRQMTARALSRLTHQLLGLGTHTPPETQVWTELAFERAMRRIARQAEAQFAAAPLRRAR